jgi:hypothetical protein
VPKDPLAGSVDPEALPPVWDQITERALSEFEQMSLVGAYTLPLFSSN